MHLVLVVAVASLPRRRIARVDVVDVAQFVLAVHIARVWSWEVAKGLGHVCGDKWSGFGFTSIARTGRS